ncbi:Protein CBG01336 [Caenorhabditis briggsae]|uniref:Protein CBG01336 n=1 Tax=Caenorhabditis briggsae TaxID=6238 RepID=A8WQ61_CAEBR|nr:Protein CBG01336 [Caenorhabditis briggsae]CAP22619.2 Protein CBG01336 [Caenorhabditis briggsae]
MKFTPWVNLAHLIARVGFFVTSFSTTLFLILTIFYVKEKVGSYRYLLLLLPVTGFFFASFEFLIDPFAYRYWAVFRPRYIKKFFDGPRFIFPILYMLSGGSCWFLACFVFNQPDNYSLEYLGPDVYESYGVILSEQPLLLVVAYDKEGLIRFSNSFGLFLMASFLVIAKIIFN